MRLHDYRCDTCGSEGEVLTNLTWDQIDICPSCGEQTAVILVSAPNVRTSSSATFLTGTSKNENAARRWMKAKHAMRGKSGEDKREAHKEMKDRHKEWQQVNKKGE
jgi:putative FmdB family regulatory protein